MIDEALIRIENAVNLQVAIINEGGRFVYDDETLANAVDGAGLGEEEPKGVVTVLDDQESGNATSGYAYDPELAPNDPTGPIPLPGGPKDGQNVVVVGNYTPAGELTTSKVLEKGLELTGRASEEPFIQTIGEIVNTALSVTPKGMFENLAAGVLNRAAPEMVASLAGNIDELKTRVGVALDSAVTGDGATGIRADYNAGADGPAENNYFEVTGGKVAVDGAAAIVLGNLGRKLGKGGKGDADTANDSQRGGPDDPNFHKNEPEANLALPRYEGQLIYSSKIERQMKKRGWTDQMVREALMTDGIPTSGKLGPATRHVHPRTGQSIVKDNKTGEIFHVGGPGYEYD